ncbi:TPA: prepilin-type cleavage/methylation domain-containing protein [Candidatus Berkelbacteria bacterium]|uniref:Uncharacterized protein n=1 Tax=Berkelbacteria bacterium GW2011_GWE1_39_12 TaxID=1618337 RepID=A0A0G4B396_9BACT|nr:MAG: hypothetical protein UT28_C0001G0074 [Berkelbacteria bacterium GW2011_GWE1_39_12]HBO60466.1 prepilin-type cleavage/methylation domain-containing protein [Candidatus Berkelbacteria bacterium]
MMKTSKGFTLAEMMVVIGIVGILGALSFSSYYTVRKVRDVQVAAQKTSDTILRARSYAISPKNMGVSSVWVNVITSPTKKLTVTENSALGARIFESTLPSSITISGGPISFNASGQTAKKSLVLTGPTGESYKVNVFQNGSVDVKKN